MQPAVAYIRVSTQEQAQHGVSLEAQEARVRAYCLMADLHLVSVVREEGVSASKSLATRPGGQSLARLVAQGEARHVVSLKMDRLFRDALDCLTQTRAWTQAGVSVHLVDMGGQTLNTGSAMGKMFLTITAAFAELERNLISERTSLALQHKKAQGVRLGAPSLNDPAAVARMLALRSEGLPLRGICAALAREGFQTCRGGRWAPETVSRVLARTAAAGTTLT